MGAQGEATIDFSTGNSEASVAVTGQASILATSHAEPYNMVASTADHNEDEHLAESEDIDLICGVPTAGVGFTIYARTKSGKKSNGQFKIKWVWN